MTVNFFLKWRLESFPQAVDNFSTGVAAHHTIYQTVRIIDRFLSYTLLSPFPIITIHISPTIPLSILHLTLYPLPYTYLPLLLYTYISLSLLFPYILLIFLILIWAISYILSSLSGLCLFSFFSYLLNIRYNLSLAGLGSLVGGMTFGVGPLGLEAIG